MSQFSLSGRVALSTFQASISGVRARAFSGRHCQVIRKTEIFILLVSAKRNRLVNIIMVALLRVQDSAPEVQRTDLINATRLAGKHAKSAWTERIKSDQSANGILHILRGYGPMIRPEHADSTEPSSFQSEVYWSIIKTYIDLTPNGQSLFKRYRLFVSDVCAGQKSEQRPYKDQTVLLEWKAG